MRVEEIKNTLEKYQRRSQSTEVIMAFGHAIALIDKLTPIELPTDEEIDKNGYHDEKYNQVWTEGAKWMRDKIGGNK